MKFFKLKKAAEFKAVFKKGFKFYSQTLCVIYLKNSVGAKMGIAVSKKHGKAVKRNKIKRLLRAAFFSAFANAGAKGFYIILPKIAEEYEYQRFLTDISFCLKKIQKQ